MIKLTKTEVSILGRPNFVCSPMAHILIKAGVYEDAGARSEYEQAVFIHWALELHKKHGDEWTVKAEEILQECHAKNQGREKS